MPRLFTAIHLPKEQKLSLLSRMAGLPKVRWQTEDQLHLTLRFIGEVEENRAEDLDELRNKVRETARSFIASETRRSPMIIPVVMEI